MKWETSPVKVRQKDAEGKHTGSVEVGTANYQVFDSVGEALSELGEAHVLTLVNAQNRTNELNRVRGENRPGGMSKTAMRNKAILTFTPTDWAEIAGDPVKLDAKVNAWVAANQPTLTAGSAADSDEDDNS